MKPLGYVTNMCRKVRVSLWGDLGAEAQALLVKSCSVMAATVPAQGPPWVNSCVCGQLVVM